MVNTSLGVELEGAILTVPLEVLRALEVFRPNLCARAFFFSSSSAVERVGEGEEVGVEVIEEDARPNLSARRFIRSLSTLGCEEHE